MALCVKGKSAIVTGAGSGINLSFAKLLLRNACNVLFADLALRPEAQELVDKHSTGATRAVFQKTDVRDWRQLEKMFRVAEDKFGKVDIVCPGAGVFEPSWSSFWHPPGTPKSRDSRTGDRYAVLDINVTHPIRTTQLAISHYLRHKADNSPKHIVHISSVAGQKPMFAHPIYVATKHAINGLVRSLAPLDAQLGIRVTAVAPGSIKTPLWTNNPEKIRMVNDHDEWVTPEEVAEVMLALIQQNEVSEKIGDKSGQGRSFNVKGGTILEVSKMVREVNAFNDPGPEQRAGNTLSNSKVADDEVLGSLKEGWGVPEQSE